MKTIFITLVISISSAVTAQVLPPPPLFTPSAEDVITLRDGTILRGHVTEMRPGDHVELVLLDGRTQSLQWVDIIHSAGPSFPEQSPADLFLRPSPERVPVLLESDRPLTVGVLRTRPLIGQSSMTFDQDGDVSQLTIDHQSRDGVVVCASTPCRIYARPGPLKLQISGSDVLSYSDDIDVPPCGARVKLRSPSAHTRRTGALLLAGTLPALIAGAAIVGLGATPGIGKPDPPPRLVGQGPVPQSDSSSIYYGIGGALLSAGGVMLVSGIALLASGSRGVESVTSLADGIRF